MCPLISLADFFTLAVFVTLTSTSFGQNRVNAIGNGGMHTIQGRIYLPNGRTVDRPIKVLLESVTHSTNTVYSDYSGGFAFRALVPGNYTVVVDAGESFVPVRESVMIDTEVQGPVRTAAAPKTFTIPIHLRLTQNVRLKNEVINSRLASIPRKALEHFQRGLELNGSEKTDEAIGEFQLAISYYAPFSLCHIELGKSYLKANKLNMAVNSLQVALKYEPNDFDARLNLGVAFLNEKRFNDAEKEFVTAAYLNRIAITPHYYLGVIYIEKQDLDIAQKALETARELAGEKSFPLLHKYLGGVYLAKKMDKQAAEELELYLKQDINAKDADRIKNTISELKKKD